MLLNQSRISLLLLVILLPAFPAFAKTSLVSAADYFITARGPASLVKALLYGKNFLEAKVACEDHLHQNPTANDAFMAIAASARLQ